MAKELGQPPGAPVRWLVESARHSHVVTAQTAFSAWRIACALGESAMFGSCKVSIVEVGEERDRENPRGPMTPERYREIIGGIMAEFLCRPVRLDRDWRMLAEEGERIVKELIAKLRAAGLEPIRPEYWVAEIDMATQRLSVYSASADRQCAVRIPEGP